MAFIYSKLQGRIREILGTQAAFAEAIGISTVSVSKKLNNGVEFSQREIMKAVEVLNIPKNEIPAYFFTTEVQKTEQEG